MCLKWKWLKWNISTNMCVCVCLSRVFSGEQLSTQMWKRLKPPTNVRFVVWVGGLDYTTQLLYRDSIPAIIRLPLKQPVSEASTRPWLQDSEKVLDFAGTAQPGGPEIQGMQVTYVFCLREGVSGLNRCTG